MPRIYKNDWLALLVDFRVWISETTSFSIFSHVSFLDNKRFSTEESFSFSNFSRFVQFLIWLLLVSVMYEPIQPAAAVLLINIWCDSFRFVTHRILICSCILYFHNILYLIHLCLEISSSSKYARYLDQADGFTIVIIMSWSPLFIAHMPSIRYRSTVVIVPLTSIQLATFPRHSTHNVLCNIAHGVTSTIDCATSYRHVKYRSSTL